MRNIQIRKEDFKHSSILHYLLDKGVIVNFHCLDGFCGTCHSKLISGEVSFIKDEIGFKAKEEFLLCCAIPKTDIEISIY